MQSPCMHAIVLSLNLSCRTAPWADFGQSWKHRKHSNSLKLYQNGSRSCQRKKNHYFIRVVDLLSPEYGCPVAFSLIEVLCFQTTGHSIAPVANCGQAKYNSQVKQDMSVAEFCDYWMDSCQSILAKDLFPHIFCFWCFWAPFCSILNLLFFATFVM